MRGTVKLIVGMPNHCIKDPVVFKKIRYITDVCERHLPSASDLGQACQERVILLIRDPHRVFGCRIVSLDDILPEFTESCDPFALQAIMFFTEIPIGPGVSRSMAAGVSEDVFSEQILRVGMWSGAHPQKFKCGAAGNLYRHPIRHDFKFRRKGTGLFQCPYLLEHAQGCLRRIPYGLEPSSPGCFRGNESCMPDHGNAVIGLCSDR